jgi:hypothetical protein
VPFAVFAAMEIIMLALLYLSPREPLVSVLGPPIRVFFGERFLHYPDNFLLLPRLGSFARSLLYVVAGSLLNGMAAVYIHRAFTGRGEKRAAFMQAFRRYFALAGISLTVTLLFVGFARALAAVSVYYFSAHPSFLRVPAGIWLGPVAFVADLAAGILIQSLFIYSTAAVMIGRKNIVSAVAASVRIFRRMPLETLLLVTAPVLAYVPVMVLQYKTPFFVSVNPESVLIIAVFGSLINSLLVDVVVMVTVTYLYMRMSE